MTTPPPSRTALEIAYREAEYRVGPALTTRLAIGIADPLLDRMLQRGDVSTAALLTAANPGSVLRSAADNEESLGRMQQQLATSGIRTLPALGTDAQGRWPDEAGVLALGIALPQATAIAASFGQFAFVWCEVGEPPRLIWTD
jgi:hypothetical protein